MKLFIIISSLVHLKEKYISRKTRSSISDNNFVIRCYKVWYSIRNWRSNEFWDVKSWSNFWYYRILTQKENWMSHYIYALPHSAPRRLPQKVNFWVPIVAFCCQLPPKQLYQFWAVSSRLFFRIHQRCCGIRSTSKRFWQKKNQVRWETHNILFHLTIQYQYEHFMYLVASAFE